MCQHEKSPEQLADIYRCHHRELPAYIQRMLQENWVPPRELQKVLGQHTMPHIGHRVHSAIIPIPPPQVPEPPQTERVVIPQASGTRNERLVPFPLNYDQLDKDVLCELLEKELKLHYETKAKAVWKKEKEKADVKFEYSQEGWQMALEDAQCQGSQLHQDEWQLIQEDTNHQERGARRARELAARHHKWEEIPSSGLGSQYAMPLQGSFPHVVHPPDGLGPQYVQTQQGLPPGLAQTSKVWSNNG